MKEKIHPKYIECTVVCGCGETFKTRSTRERIAVEICSKCHPFYTGKQKFVDTAGMVEKFQRKYDKVRDVVAEKRKKEDDEKKAKLAEQARRIEEERRKKEEDRRKKQAEREAWVARQQSVAAAKAAQAEQQATAEEARSGDAAPPAEGEKPQA